MSAKDVFVKNISFEATEEDIRKMFSVCGTVKYIRMLTDPKTGQFRGSCFVTMSSPAEAKDAVVTLDEALLINRQISVSEPRPNPARDPRATTEPAPHKKPGRKR